MIDMPTMLMIGAATSNVGKTALACGIIKRFGCAEGVIGLKVTTIAEKNGVCPRGGEGCGVCSSLEGEFAILQETSSQSGKDTAKLLAAGAEKVYWLRVIRDALEKGAKALVDTIGVDTLCVCESNSLRLVIEPGLFIMVKHKDSNTYKPSARSVLDYADKVVTFDGESFDFDISRIYFANGRWGIKSQEKT